VESTQLATFRAIYLHHPFYTRPSRWNSSTSILMR